MARVISEVGHWSAVKNRGERIVYRDLSLAPLPKQFLVFYPMNFLRDHPDGGNLVDGEGDFVVLDQERGVVLVLEVKENTIESKFVGKRRVWCQGPREIDNPWGQIRGNKYNMVDWLSKKIGCDPKKYPLSPGHALLLPDVKTKIDSPLPDMKDEVTLTWTSPEELAERIEWCSQRWKQEGHKKPTEHDIETTRILLMPEFIYGDKLADRIGVERREVKSRESSMARLVGFINNRKKARIAGCAGAGKTTLAVAKAQQLNGDDDVEKILFLVYNKALAGYLTEHLADSSKVKVQTFHDFCKDCCADDWPEEKIKDNGFWWTTAPEMLEKALKDAPVQYDALIVDEAQDFRFAAWMALEKVVRDDGWYYLFYDKVQNVFGGDLDFPVNEESFLLLANCRSTTNILEAIRQKTGIEMESDPEVPEGSPVRIESADTDSQRRKLLGKILHDWIKNEGLTENQIVVLGGHSLKNTCVGEEGMAGSFRLVDRGDPAPGVIPYYTYMAFKGCESDAVILLDVDSEDKRWDAKGLYTSMTRPRHLLAIVEK